MHPPLERPHPECQDVIQALVQCHEQHPYSKFLGACSDQKVALDHCFKKEKEHKRAENMKHAKKSDAYVRQKMQEARERRQKAD